MTINIAPLLNTIGLDAEVDLTHALTHKSHPAAKNYERLEFLGDRVLNLSIAEWLFETYPEYSEGELAKHHAALVREETLAQVADAWELNGFIRVGNSAKAQEQLPPSILADAVEAILGSLFLAVGFKILKDVILTHWTPYLETVTIQDAKSTLQEKVQAGGHPLPRYTVKSSDGKDHNKTFTIEVACVLGAATGIGSSKKAAAQAAAAELLTQLEKSQ